MATEQSFITKFDSIINLLIKHKFYTEASLTELLKGIDEANNEEKFERLVSDVESRDPNSINQFGVILRESQQFVVEQLPNELDESDSSVTETIKHAYTRFRDLLSTPKACGEVLEMTKAKKVKTTQYGDVYPMTSKPRGYCVIIDNQKFLVPSLPFRAGSRADAFRLSEVFTQLGFLVTYHVDKTVTEMENILIKLSRDPLLIYHDALAVIILSHGVTDGIYGTDGLTIQVDYILKLFNNIGCPNLVNKPKMFFLSACRGYQVDSGAEIFEYTDEELLEEKNFRFGLESLGPSDARPNFTFRRTSVPTWSDMFVCFSSVTGYASLRNVNTGSWFGYELAYALLNHANREHLLDLVTTIVGRGIQRRESENDGRVMKQAPETIVKGAVKKLYFNPGF